MRCGYGDQSSTRGSALVRASNRQAALLCERARTSVAVGVVSSVAVVSSLSIVRVVRSKSHKMETSCRCTSARADGLRRKGSRAGVLLWPTGIYWRQHTVVESTACRCMVGASSFVVSSCAHDGRHTVHGGGSVCSGVAGICDEGGTHERSGDAAGAAHIARVWTRGAERERAEHVGPDFGHAGRSPHTHEFKMARRTSVGAVDTCSIARDTPLPITVVERCGWCWIRTCQPSTGTTVVRSPIGAVCSTLKRSGERTVHGT
jgi:hypothetical protein